MRSFLGLPEKTFARSTCERPSGSVGDSYDNALIDRSDGLADGTKRCVRCENKVIHAGDVL